MIDDEREVNKYLVKYRLADPSTGKPLESQFELTFMAGGPTHAIELLMWEVGGYHDHLIEIHVEQVG